MGRDDEGKRRRILRPAGRVGRGERLVSGHRAPPRDLLEQRQVLVGIEVAAVEEEAAGGESLFRQQPCVIAALRAPARVRDRGPDPTARRPARRMHDALGGLRQSDDALRSTRDPAVDRAAEPRERPPGRASFGSVQIGLGTEIKGKLLLEERVGAVDDRRPRLRQTMERRQGRLDVVGEDRVEAAGSAGRAPR
ncbi:MAG: hypothetical protein IPK00_14025 [Deltaproteobacteria bacterium]|nr:hypothetical protein [Deltaproteobacteria bacterium]